MNWYWWMLLAAWTYFVFRFGKGFGMSLAKLPYKWTCFVEKCDTRFQATDANILWRVAADHVMKFHPPEVQDGAVSSPEEGSR